LDTASWSSGCHGQVAVGDGFVVLIGSDLVGRSMAVALDQPVGVVPNPERAQRVL
jgi:hypothetical protein